MRKSSRQPDRHLSKILSGAIRAGHANLAPHLEYIAWLCDRRTWLAGPTFGLADVPEIVASVEHTGRRTAVLVGMETDVCVAQSALGLLDEDFTVAVVEDAVREMLARAKGPRQAVVLPISKVGGGFQPGIDPSRMADFYDLEDIEYMERSRGPR